MGEKVNDIFGASELKERKANLAKALLAELLGTLFLVFFGCGAAVAGSRTLTTESLGQKTVTILPSAFITQVGLTFGLAVAAIVQAIGHVSGGHINPAVTLGVMVAGQMSILRGLLYMLAQFIGGIIGASLIFAVTWSKDKVIPDGLGANGLQPGIQPWQGFIVEFLVTFLFVLVVFGVCDSRRDDIKGSIPLAVGLAVGVGHLLTIGYTGCGMNPARTFGPLVVGGVWKPESDWIYFVGPFLGGATAALVYNAVFKAIGASEDF